MLTSGTIQRTIGTTKQHGAKNAVFYTFFSKKAPPLHFPLPIAHKPFPQKFHVYLSPAKNATRKRATATLEPATWTTSF